VTSLLELRDVTKTYGGLVAVDRASFVVEPGKITALIGPNGAGKTTAFDAISGIIEPDEGSIDFDGREITGMMPHKITARGIGRTFQITRELGDMTVLENMVVPNANRGLRGLIGARIDESEEQRALGVLEFLGIAHLTESPAKRLSYGQKKLLSSLQS
jgi:neutral amino acid transport system ATP-binding protein